VTEDHERIDELLAGYVLLSLSGDEAAEADRILVDHVPSCATCRATLSEFQAVSGDLALAAPPVDPPETLLPRLHHAMDEVPLAGRTPRRGALIAVAASAVALVAMGGLSLVLGNRLSNSETRTGTALEILSAMRSPGASPVNVEPQDQTPPDSGMVEVSAPNIRRLYIAAEYCPEPAPGRLYQLWLGSNGQWTPVDEMFWPEDGVLLLEVEGVDVSRYDEIWITEEVIGSHPTVPNTDGPSWRASLTT
jgi:Anti-sigma-K factor rskA, C-terminal